VKKENMLAVHWAEMRMIGWMCDRFTCNRLRQRLRAIDDLRRTRQCPAVLTAATRRLHPQSCEKLVNISADASGHLWSFIIPTPVINTKEMCV